MSDETIVITGLRETQKALYAYSQQLGDRVVISSLRQGANLVKRAIERQVPVRTGKLKRGFKVAKSRIHSGKMSDSLIGVYLTLRKGKTAPFYGRFINDGWNAGKTKVPGLHFVQSAFQSNKQSAVNVIVASAEAGAAVLARKVNL